jgi:pyruvate formate lyase activating enzyme
MRKISKRQFIKQSILCMGGAFCYNLVDGNAAWRDKDMRKWSREALFYSETPRGVKCLLCPNECSINPGLTGNCKCRINKDGKLYTMAYGDPCAVNIDPIEKKPLLHFFPKSQAFSVGTAGCNFVCLNCQNWNISQTSPAETSNIDLMPEKVVEGCIENKCLSIAYTYNEPTVFYEYMLDTAKIAKAKGIKNVLVSNGYINNDPLLKLIPYLDAANIDLKSFDDNIYLKLNGGKLQPILNTLKTLKQNNVWLEITNLVVPTWTDNPDMIKRMCEWLVTNGFAEYPLHFSRFFPAYKLTNLKPTPIDFLVKARDIAEKAGHKYVYIGNTTEEGSEDTICPQCKKKVVERRGYTVTAVNLVNGKCKFCGHKINGVWG